MEKAFNILIETRKNIKALVEKYSIDQLNNTPAGFRNNILWNLGHVVVTQQLLCYKNADSPVLIPDDIVESFKKGTSPARTYSKDELQYLLDKLEELATRVRSDYQSGHFKTYNSYTTSYGVALNSIEDAIAFNNTHEGLHYGYMMAMSKLI